MGITQHKRDCILQAAGRFFSRFGFKKTSVDDIAEEAGVGKGTVYLACRSKSDLFVQVLHRQTREWVADVVRALDPGQSSWQQLRVVAQESLRAVAERPLVRDLLVGAVPTATPEELVELRRIARGNLIEVLDRGVREGAFRAELDVQRGATIVQDLMAASLLFHTDNPAEVLLAHIDTVQAAFCQHAVAARAPARRRAS